LLTRANAADCSFTVFRESNTVRGTRAHNTLALEKSIIQDDKLVGSVTYVILHYGASIWCEEYNLRKQKAKRLPQMRFAFEAASFLGG